MIKIYIAIIFSLLFVSINGFSQNTNYKSDNLSPAGAILFDKGIAAIDKKDYLSAVAIFSKIIKVYPKLSLAYFNRGLAFSHLNKPTEAISDYTKALDSDLVLLPERISKDSYLCVIYSGRAIVFNSQFKYTEAVSDCSKGIQLDPKHLKTYLIRAQSYYGQQKYEEAITDCNNVLETDPKNIWSFKLRSDSLRAIGKIIEADADLEKISQLNKSPNGF
jgi:tetratricopeptide (TPR) repeat protein